MARADISHLGLDISQVIDRRVYTDQVVYDTELERVFNKTWQFVAHVSELKGPGDFISTSIANQSVLVCRDRHLNLRAFYNVCTHRGAMLTNKRRGNTGVGFRCMYHGWTYDL